MRVLLLAEDCNPEWPSLPVVGYKASLALADQVEVVLATQVRNRSNIDKHGAGRAEVEFIDTEYIAAPLYKAATLLRGGGQAAWTTATAMGYPGAIAFDREVWRRFGRDLEAGKFDLVHRLTPMSPTLPSPIASRCRVPFVLGPLNGGLKWPLEYRAEFRQEREYLRKLRGLYKILPYHRSTLRSSRVILASFRHTIADLPAWARQKTINFPEVGVDASLFASTEAREESKELTILSAGRFVPLKLLDVVLHVMASSPALRAQKLVLAGDGMERAALERLAEDLGLHERVEFTGWQTQAEVAGHMKRADIFLLPSIRELGGGVVVEAMAAGCAPVVVDYGGPGELVGMGRGTKVPLGPRPGLIQGLRLALERYVEDRSLLRDHAARARSWALEHLDWRAKARKTVEIYEWALDGNPDRHRPLGLESW